MFIKTLVNGSQQHARMSMKQVKRKNIKKLYLNELGRKHENGQSLLHVH